MKNLRNLRKKFCESPPRGVRVHFGQALEFYTLWLLHIVFTICKLIRDLISLKALIAKKLHCKEIF